MVSIYIIGNITAEPELRFTQNGKAVASFTVVDTPRKKNAAGDWEDGTPTFWNCSVWDQQAENAAGSLDKGARVFVTGRTETREYESREGEKRSSLNVQVDEMGPCLKYATAAVTKVVRNGNQDQRQAQRQGQRSGPVQRQQRPQRPVQDDPWASDDQYNDSQVAF